MNLAFLDTEHNGESPFSDKFWLRLIGHIGNWRKADLVVIWGLSDALDLKNYSIAGKWYNLKSTCQLIDENYSWSLDKAMKKFNIPSHKYLVKQWELKGYTWGDVPMKLLVPYNKLDVLRLRDIFTNVMSNSYFLKNLNKNQDRLIQDTNNALIEMMKRGIQLSQLKNSEATNQYQLAITDRLTFLKSIDSEINWNSSAQVGSFLKELGFKLPKTPSGQLKVTKHVLEALPKLNSKSDAIVKALLNLKELTQNKSAFLDKVTELTDSSFRLHPYYSFAHTGRYRTSRPNIQNFPKKQDSILRQQIISKFPNGELIAVDWAQLEICIIAMAYELELLKLELRSSEDIHQRSAEFLGVDRRIAKQCNFSLFYGGTAWTLNKYGIKGSLADRFVQDMYNRYPGILLAHDKFQQQTKAGEVTSLFGKKRHTDIITQAYNFPIQSVAGDLNKLVLICASKLSKELGFESHPIFDVHDELVFDVKQEERNDYLSMVIGRSYSSIYSNISDYFHIDWDIPLSYEVSVGKNYGDLWDKRYFPNDFVHA